MKKERPDAADAVFEALKRDDALELSDRDAGERLERELARIRPAGGARAARRWATAAAVLVVATSAAMGAGLGWEAVSRWWYRFTIDGQEFGGVVEGDGQREHHYTTDDGVDVHVKVGRRSLEGGGVETRASIEARGEHGEDEDVLVRQEVPGEAAQSPWERLPVEGAAGAQPLHSWKVADGSQRALLLGVDPEGLGSRLLLRVRDAADELSLYLVQRTARPIGPGGRVDVEELGDGLLQVRLSDGHGWELEVLLGASGPPILGELRSPHGRLELLDELGYTK